MATKKRSISLDESLAERIVVAAREDGVSFSSWLSAMAEEKLLLRDGLRGVEEWEAEAGALTPEELSAGETLLDRLLGLGKRASLVEAEFLTDDDMYDEFGLPK